MPVANDVVGARADGSRYDRLGERGRGNGGENGECERSSANHLERVPFDGVAAAVSTFRRGTAHRLGGPHLPDGGAPGCPCSITRSTGAQTRRGAAVSPRCLLDAPSPGDRGRG
jgi:hypothetical protein